MSRASAVAPSNIAFVKYWGTRDLDATLPFDPSISMTLSECLSYCTVETLEGSGPDRVDIASESGALQPAGEGFAAGVRGHLDRIRGWSGSEARFRVAARNTFPTGAGMASSASGFTALALATSAALGRAVEGGELSELARISGSGSAARSAFGGYVEWPVDEEGSAAVLAPETHWALSDVVAVVDDRPKDVSSREGHRRAPTSPYFEPRRALLAGRLRRVREAISARDFGSLAEVLEEEAIDLHVIAMTSRPPIFYWSPATLAVLEKVRDLRSGGVPAASTIDAGPNVHVVCPSDVEEEVARAIGSMDGVVSVLRDRVGGPPRITGEHLF